MLLCYHAVMLSCCCAIMLLWYHAVMLLCYHAIMLSCCHAAVRGSGEWKLYTRQMMYNGTWTMVYGWRRKQKTLLNWWVTRCVTISHISGASLAQKVEAVLPRKGSGHFCHSTQGAGEIPDKCTPIYMHTWYLLIFRNAYLQAHIHAHPNTFTSKHLHI